MFPRMLILQPFLFLVLACTSGSGTASGDAGAPAPSSTSTGDDSAPSTSGDDSSTLVNCQNDRRVDTYVANLTKTSTDGALKITLVSADPAPPAIDSNTWIIRATDGSGTPMTHATLKVAPFMPDHNHGTSIIATITPQSDGSYTVTPLYLFMPGVWRIRFSVPATDAGPLPESVDCSADIHAVCFYFCIAG
jgi:hypothetical protein